MSTDVPTGLVFVNPAEIDPTYRVVLWAEPGAGKSVAATSAPGPLLVLTADRPSAYRYARKHHQGKVINEVRYEGPKTLEAVYEYLKAPDNGIKTVIVDPVGNIYDQLAEAAPLMQRKGEAPGPDYQWVNKKLLGFIKSLRRFDVNVVLVAHEKLNDGKHGDNKLYPHLGGGTLINKTLAEMDIVAHVERITTGDGDEAEVKWIGQIQPVRNLVVKDGTNALGDRRILDLTRWFDVANEALAPDNSDLPFDPEAPVGDPEEADSSAAKSFDGMPS